jgi:hypothetical protein
LLHLSIVVHYDFRFRCLILLLVTFFHNHLFLSIAFTSHTRHNHCFLSFSPSHCTSIPCLLHNCSYLASVFALQHSSFTVHSPITQPICVYFSCIFHRLFRIFLLSILGSSWPLDDSESFATLLYRAWARINSLFVHVNLYFRQNLFSHLRLLLPTHLFAPPVVL